MYENPPVAMQKNVFQGEGLMLIQKSRNQLTKNRNYYKMMKPMRIRLKIFKPTVSKQNVSWQALKAKEENDIIRLKTILDHMFKIQSNKILRNLLVPKYITLSQTTTFSNVKNLSKSKYWHRHLSSKCHRNHQIWLKLYKK